MFDYPYVLCMLYVLQLQQYFSQFIFYSKNLKTPMGKKSTESRAQRTMTIFMISKFKLFTLLVVYIEICRGNSFKTLPKP